MRFTERTLVVNCKQVNGHHCKPKPLFRGATPASPNCQRLAVDPCVLPREPCVLPRESRNHLSPGQVAGRDRGVVWFWSDFNARFAYPAAQSRSLDRQSRFDAGTFRSSAFSIGNFDRQFRSAISIGWGEEVGNPRNQNRSSSAVASEAPIRMAEQSSADCFLLR